MKININKPEKYLSKELNKNFKWYKKYFFISIDDFKFFSKHLSKKHSLEDLNIMLSSLTRNTEGQKHFAPIQLLITTFVTLAFGFIIGIFNFVSNTTNSNLSLLWNSALKLRDRIPVKLQDPEIIKKSNEEILKMINESTTQAFDITFNLATKSVMYSVLALMVYTSFAVVNNKWKNSSTTFFIQVVEESIRIKKGKFKKINRININHSRFLSVPTNTQEKIAQ